MDKGGYRGLTQTDRYGRIIPKAAHGTVRFDAPTNLGSTLINESAKLFERITNPALTVRRITLNANKVTPDEGFYQVDFHRHQEAGEGEKAPASHAGHQEQVRQKRRAESQQLRRRCTMRQRNAQIGGHSAGGSDGNYKNSKIGQETAKSTGTS